MNWLTRNGSERPPRIMAAMGPPEDEASLLRAVGDLAVSSRATLWIVHVVEPVARPSGRKEVAFETLDYAERSLIRGLERARLESQDVRPLILSGAVETELPSAAAMMEVDLVVLGTEPGRLPLDLLARLNVRCPTCRLLILPRTGDDQR